MRTRLATVGTPVPGPLPVDAPAARAHPGRGPRVVACAVLLLYLAGVVVQVVLGLRLHTLGNNPGQGLVIWIGFASFAGLGALLVGMVPLGIGLGVLLNAVAPHTDLGFWAAITVPYGVAWILLGRSMSASGRTRTAEFAAV